MEASTPPLSEVSDLEQAIAYNYKQLQDVRQQDPKVPEIEQLLEQRLNSKLDIYADAIRFSGSMAVASESE